MCEVFCWKNVGIHISLCFLIVSSIRKNIAESYSLANSDEIYLSSGLGFDAEMIAEEISIRYRISATSEMKISYTDSQSTTRGATVTNHPTLKETPKDSTAPSNPL